MQKTRFDIDCESLDLFFVHEIEKISPIAKAELPKDIAFKLFRGGGKFNTNSTSKLGFIAKLYILWKCLNKRWWIVIEDEEKGMTPGQFMDLRKAYRKRDYSIEQGVVLKSSGEFVLANKELSECFSYLNRLSTGPAYNYLMGGKNKVHNHTEDWAKKMRYIATVFAHYESQKKSWVSGMGVSIPEWLILIYLYPRGPVNGGPIYKEFYKRAYQSSPTKLVRSFSVLQRKGYIEKTGSTKQAQFNITASGIDVVNSILTKYALNP